MKNPPGKETGGVDNGNGADDLGAWRKWRAIKNPLFKRISGLLQKRARWWVV